MNFDELFSCYKAETDSCKRPFEITEQSGKTAVEKVTFKNVSC